MALKCGIVGLTNVGKTTLFNCVSNTKAEATSFAFSTNKSNMGTVEVPDPRQDVLKELYSSQKIIPVSVELVDIPGLAKGASKGEGIGNSFLADIRQSDALIHVLRCFDDINLPHVEGSVDPVRDIEILEFELQIKDLEQVERKMQRLEKMAKTGDKDAKKGFEVLSLYKAHFENFQPARTIELSEDDKKHAKELCLLTEKPVMYVCNVDEKSAVTGNAYVEKVKESLKGTDAEVLVIAGAVEAEIAELDAEDGLVFLNDLGLEEPGVDKVVRAAYKLLNLSTFFTCGPKEIHSWTIKNGMTAPQAAGVIHSDLERGFIRAEVIKYNDIKELKTEAKCREAGKFNVEGKTYLVQDGDLLNIRFNV